MFFAAEIDGLAQEAALDQDIRVDLAQFVGLAARVTGDAKSVAEAEPLIDFGVDPDLATRPWSKAGVERCVKCFAAVGVGPKAAVRCRARGKRAAASM